MNQCETCGKPSQTYKIVGNMRQGKTTAKHLCYPCADRDYSISIVPADKKQGVKK